MSDSRTESGSEDASSPKQIEKLKSLTKAPSEKQTAIKPLILKKVRESDSPSKTQLSGRGSNLRNNPSKTSSLKNRDKGVRINGDVSGDGDSSPLKRQRDDEGSSPLKAKKEKVSSFTFNLRLLLILAIHLTLFNVRWQRFNLKGNN